MKKFILISAPLFCFLTSVLLSMKVIIANTTKAQPDSARTTDAELLINQKLDELYPETESIKGYTKHLRLTAEETKIVKLGIPQIPGDLSSPPLYDKDVIISAGKNDCRFVLWETVAGAKLTEKDVAALCAGKQTGIKHCTSKAGKNFDCRFVLDEEKKIKFVFEEA